MTKAAFRTACVCLGVLAIFAMVTLTSAQERTASSSPANGNNASNAPGVRLSPSNDARAVTVVADDDEEIALAMKKLLATKIAKVDFQEMELNKAIAWLCDSAGMSVTVNYAALGNAGINKDILITMHLKNATLKTVLNQLMDVAGGTASMGYITQDGIVKISTKADLAKTTVTRLYDVRDLFTRDQIEIPGYEVDDAASVLSEQVQRAVAADSWRDSGGTISVRNGQLIVTQSHDVHDQIEAYLAKVREAAVPKWKAEIRTKLQAKMDVALDNAKLEDALKVVREKAGVNLAVDPALKQITMPAITLNLKGVTAQQVIGMLTDMTKTKALLKNGAIYITGDVGSTSPGMPTLPVRTMPPATPQALPATPDVPPPGK